MLQKIEFYNSPDGTIHVQHAGERIKVFDESCKDIVQEIIVRIRDLYTDAYNALADLYNDSKLNRPYFDFKIVHRFIRCNFGEFDALSFDLDAAGNFNIEHVHCPMRGECQYEGVICMPRLNTALSARETEVVSMLLKGYEKTTIAEELRMSPYTVNRHLANIRQRLGLKSTNQIITHFANGPIKF